MAFSWPELHRLGRLSAETFILDQRSMTYEKGAKEKTTSLMTFARI
jgi:hypothetical protein